MKIHLSQKYFMGNDKKAGRINTTSLFQSIHIPNTKKAVVINKNIWYDIFNFLRKAISVS